MSTTLASGANTTITLPAGQVLYTGKTGNGVAVIGPGPQAGQTFTLGTGARIGPYGNDVSVFLTSNSGDITYQAGAAPGVPPGVPIAMDPLGPTIPGDGAAAVRLYSPKLNDVNAAATNTAMIAAALLAGGAVTLSGTGVAYVNDTLVIPSDTTFSTSNVKLRMVPGISRNMLVNAAHLTPWTNITGNFTASGTTGTVNHTAHGKAVGDYVSLRGSLLSGYNGVYRVETVPNANSFTVRLAIAPTTSPSTGTVQIKDADRNISLQGVSFDYNDPNGVFASTTQMHCVVINNAQRPVIRDFFAEQCSKYALIIGAVADFDFRNLRFNNSRGGSDGLHFNGPAFRGVSSGHYGRTGDDFVSFTVGDYVNWEISRGDFVGITIRDVFAEKCDKNLVKYAGNAPYTMDDCEFDGLGGFCDLCAVNIVDDTDFGYLLGTKSGEIRVKNISAYTGSGQAAVEVRAGGRIESLIVDGVDVDKINNAAVVKLNKSQYFINSVLQTASDNGQVGVVKVRGVVSRNQPSTGVSGVAIGGVATGNPFTVDSVDADMDIKLQTGHGVIMNSTAASTVLKSLKLSGRITGPGGGSQTACGVYNDFGTIQRANLSGLSFDGLQMLYRQNDNAGDGTYLSLSGINGLNYIRLLDFRRDGNISLGNSVILSNPTVAGNAPVRVTGTAKANTVRIEGDITAVGSTSIDVEVVGSGNGGSFDPLLSLRGRLRLNGAQIGASPSAGDEFYNTNQTTWPTAGSGQAGRYARTSAGAWVKLF
jgi:hypothetical protein